MKSHRYKFEGIDCLCFVVALKIYEKCLFVGEIPVISDMVVDFEVI